MQDKKYDDFFDEEKGGTSQQKELLTMLDPYTKPTVQTLKTGTKIKGVVARIGAETVFVSVDGKVEAVLKISEVTGPDGAVTVKAGDPIDCYVSSTAGGVELTMSLQGFSANVTDLVTAMKDKVPIQGKVTGINKGGLQVKIMGHRAFCPISFIDIKYVDDVNVYLNKTMTFVIERISEGGKNLVVTRIPILEEELWKKLDVIEAGIPERKTYSGAITRVAEFGLFVDMGGVEGLVHISEVSWERSEKLAESFSPGQQVEYIVLKIERKGTIKTTKISLSMKQALPDPWLTAAEKFPAGSQVQGTITRLANFGAFVQLTPGVEGLIHISEMSWNRRIRKPDDVVTAGQAVTVTILGVDQAKREIRCSLKSVDQDPWLTVPERFPVSAIVSGTVAQQTQYGFFVDLADGVTGLLVNQNIAPAKKGDVKVGNAIDVSIDSLDTEQRRIGLSYGMAQSKADQAAVKDYMEKMQQKAAPKATPEKSSSEFGDLLLNALKKKS